MNVLKKCITKRSSSYSLRKIPSKHSTYIKKKNNKQFVFELILELNDQILILINMILFHIVLYHLILVQMYLIIVMNNEFYIFIDIIKMNCDQQNLKIEKQTI